MARIVKPHMLKPEWPARPSEATPAPHHYTWNEEGYDPETDPALARTWDEFKARVPYREGDVVFIARDGRALKALILDVFSERDRFGDRRAKFRVAMETKRDTWSRSWEFSWPGFVQRGYHAAGLAPDLDGKV